MQLPGDTCFSWVICKWMHTKFWDRVGTEQMAAEVIDSLANMGGLCVLGEVNAQGLWGIKPMGVCLIFCVFHLDSGHVPSGTGTHGLHLRSQRFFRLIGNHKDWEAHQAVRLSFTSQVGFLLPFGWDRYQGSQLLPTCLPGNYPGEHFPLLLFFQSYFSQYQLPKERSQWTNRVEVGGQKPRIKSPKFSKWQN